MKKNTDCSWRIILLEQKDVTWGGNLAAQEHTGLLGEQRSWMLLCARHPGPQAFVPAMTVSLFAKIAWSWSCEERMRLGAELSCV